MKFITQLCVILAVTNFAAYAKETKDPTDVTAAVSAAVKDESLSIVASNDMFGDPADGIPKKLKVDYRFGNQKLSKEVAEGGKIEVAAPAGEKLTIIKAVYGPVDGSKPASTSAITEDPGALLDVLPGFKIEHILSADKSKNGSWICLAKDPQGRLLLGGQSGQPITRVTIKDGKVEKQEILSIPVSETMGMLYVGNVLYINGNGSKGFALYRCKDTKGNDSYDDVEFLRAWPGGSGEHGAHALVLGADNMLYAVCGNFTDAPKDVVESSPHRNYADDLAIKRMEDGNGFGAGRMPPGGFVCRMDLDGNNAELFSAGQRNNYDIAFNADGELFGYDSDMEWDWGSPWYRPTRVFQAVRGGDHGFREGSGKWPEYYPDSLPATINIGIGCPTGVVFGTGAKFPAKYQKAFYICDWTFGRLIAVHMTPSGASYTATQENFVAPKSLRSKTGKTPLNLTDVLIGADGAMYFTVGGRGTQANLFRVTHTGNDNPVLTAAQIKDEAGREARGLRRKLEAMNVKADPSTVDVAWSQLRSPDRYIRYAARLAIERNPIAEWQAKALAEKQPDAAFTAFLALARLGAADSQPALLKALAAFPASELSEAQLLEKLRVIEVSIARQGVPTGAHAQAVIAELDPLYPAKSESLNRELCQILLAMEAPTAVAKTVALLKSAVTQEEQLAYAVALRKIKAGWNPDLHKDYMTWFAGGRSNQHPPMITQWFTEAGINFNNGSSFQNFITKLQKEAMAALTPAEMAALGDLNKPKPETKTPVAARKLVKDWKTADLQPLLDKVGKGRDFARGKAAYESAQCILCHRYGDSGGAVAPDLTNVATRFKRQDLLESITEPSKVVSEQYMNSILKMTDGNMVMGRIAEETADKVVVMPNPFDPATVSVNKADIKSREQSKISIMPAGLLNTHSEEEILDLLAYLESMGDPKHPNFSK